MRIRSVLVCLFVLFVGTFVDIASAQNVTWTGAVNVTITGTTLQKTSGCDGCDDAGAASVEQISSGDGYVEFTIGEIDTFFLAGLSHGDNGTGYCDIDYAFRFNGGGWADVLEGCSYQSNGDTPYQVGDVFRVAVSGNKVQFIRNGFVILEQVQAVQYPLLLDTALGSVGASVQNARVVVAPPPDGTGGFVEKAGSHTYRGRFTAAQIQSFLPASGARGTFTFPAPYNTRGIRLTNASDCADAQDCVWYVGYSYWRNINNHVGSSSMLLFLGLSRDRGGAGPTLFAVNKLTDEVQKVGPLFDESSTYSYATGEGWYFSATKPRSLYTFLVGGGRLRRYDVLAHEFEATDALNIDACPPRVCPADASTIIQPHSSDDDLVHSVTVQDALFQRLGCLVYRSQRRQFQYYAVAPGYTFDECHVDKSGSWLIILEGDPSGRLRNRIVNLVQRTTRIIDDANGSLGHLDMGFGYAVGADNYNGLPNATITLDLADTNTQRPVGPVVHFNKRWDIVAANHIAHGNARPGVPPESQYACGSNASRVPDMADEIVCFPLDPNRNADGSLDVLVVGQTLTDLDALGGQGDYERTPKGNLDVTGKYFIWTTNLGGDRMDAVLVKVPSGLLGTETSSLAFGLWSRGRPRLRTRD